MQNAVDFTILYHKKDLLWFRYIDYVLRSRGYTTAFVDFTSGRVRSVADWALSKSNEYSVRIVLEADEMFAGGSLVEDWNHRVTDALKQSQCVLFRRKGLQQPKLKGTFNSEAIGDQEDTLNDHINNMLGSVQLRNINRDAIRDQFSEESPIYPGNIPRNFLMPYNRPSKFAGRQEEMDALIEAVPKNPAVLIRNRVGGRGFGLSALMAHFVYQNIEKFSTVWWMSANDPLFLADGLRELGARYGIYGLSGGLAGNWTKIVAGMAGKSKLPFLVILDRPGEHTIKELEALYDKPWKGGTLIALSAEPKRENIPEIGVGMISREDGYRLVSGIVSEADAGKCEDLVTFLKQHPLLIRMAARVVKGGKTLDRYMDDFQLEAHLVRVPEVYMKPFMINTHFVLDQLQFSNVDAEKLLVFGSYFAALPIPACVFEPTRDHNHQLAPVFNNPARLNTAINLLEEYGVITRSQETFIVHPLISQCIRQMDDYRRDWPDIILRTLSERLSPTLPAETLDDRRNEIYPHAVQMCLERVRSGAITNDSLVLINNIANKARALQNLPVALELLQALMNYYTQQFGENNANVSGLAINLGLIYKLDNRLPESLASFQRALHIDQSVLGNQHINVAEDHKQIARLYEMQKDFSQANFHYQQAVEITRTQLGTAHPHYARLLADYIPVLKVLKNTAPIYGYAKTVVEIETKTFGADSPKLCNSLATLGIAAAEAGNISEATHNLTRSMELEQKIYGTNHPKIAVRLGQLANIAEKTGDKSAALEKYQTALSIFNSTIGADHPSTKIIAECVKRLKS